MQEPSSINPTGLNTGQLRERIWSELVRQNACAYPMPPHGHNPNFKSALAASKRLLVHSSITNSNVILIGMEAVLGGIRGLLLEQGKTILVPQRNKPGFYWRVMDAPKTAAKLPNLPIYGLSTKSLDDAQTAIIASVIIDATGARWSKGFGWSQHGAPINVPTLSLAHPLMFFNALDLQPDSQLIACATPKKLITF